MWGYLTLRNQPIAGCRDCGVCSKLHKCVIDDSVNAFREKAAEFDGYVFGTPVYYSGMNGSLKSFMDRVFFSDLWGGKNTFRYKPAAAVVSARRAGCTETYNQLIKYFAHDQMPIVTSTYWNLIYGMTPEQTMEDAEGLRTMQNLGKNMAYLIKCMDAGKQLGIENPNCKK